MLGETRPNNDVYIFFEKEEIARLESETIKGTYFNFKDPSKTCLLEASIEEMTNHRIETLCEKDDKGFMIQFHIQINKERYDKLIRTGSSGIHEGYRHIELIDVSTIENLNPGDQCSFRQLKHYESRYGTLNTE